MHGFLKTDSVPFDPEEVCVIAAAFDQAWEAIQTSGVTFDTDAHAGAARASIAKHIIEAATRGERNERRLCDAALVAITQANLRSTRSRERPEEHSKARNRVGR